MKKQQATKQEKEAVKSLLEKKINEAFEPILKKIRKMKSK